VSRFQPQLATSIPGTTNVQERISHGQPIFCHSNNLDGLFERQGWEDGGARTHGYPPALHDLDKVLDEAIVKVLPSQMGVSGCGLHLEHSLVDGEHRDIEGTATQIEDEDVLLTGCPLFVKTCKFSVSVVAYTSIP
jgi:hypothetical protein